jgi:hypothetical protein
MLLIWKPEDEPMQVVTLLDSSPNSTFAKIKKENGDILVVFSDELHLPENMDQVCKLSHGKIIKA